MEKERSEVEILQAERDALQLEVATLKANLKEAKDNVEKYRAWWSNAENDMKELRESVKFLRKALDVLFK